MCGISQSPRAGRYCLSASAIALQSSLRQPERVIAGRVRLRHSYGLLGENHPVLHAEHRAAALTLSTDAHCKESAQASLRSGEQSSTEEAESESPCSASSSPLPLAWGDKEWGEGQEEPTADWRDAELTETVSLSSVIRMTKATP